MKKAKAEKTTSEAQSAEVNKAIATLQAAASLDYAFTVAQLAALAEVSELIALDNEPEQQKTAQTAKSDSSIFCSTLAIG